MNGRQAAGSPIPKDGAARDNAVEAKDAKVANLDKDVVKEPDGPPKKNGISAATKVERAAPRAKRITNSIGMELVQIPAGSFKMGSPKSETGGETFDEKQHDVTITKPFYLGVYEVTQDQYEIVMGANPSNFKMQGEEAKKFPVERVSWEDAQEFCKRLSDKPDEKKAGYKYRLPTEAEWEYACRGGADEYRVFHYGNSLSLQDANFYGMIPYGGAGVGPYRKTTKVGSYKPNAFGVYDMHGNVSEWCQDWYDVEYLDKSPQRNSGGLSGGHPGPVFRGGDWGSNGEDCRAARRRSYHPSERVDHIGFRVARVPSGE